MTKDEALKQALDALEAGDWYIGQLELLVYSVDDDGTHENRAKVQNAISALKEALAQPEQAPVQEPIGYFTVNDYDNWEQIAGTSGKPLYEFPAAQPADPTGQAPCVRHCEANAFKIVIRGLKGDIERLKAQLPKEKNT